METLAYLYLELAYEAPTNETQVFTREILKLFEWLKWQKVISHARIYLLLLVAILNILGVAGEALAQRVLDLGDRGSEVTEVQRRLRDLRYFDAQITGYFGSVTRQAVIQFQQDNGLQPDGIVGSGTRAALFGSVASELGRDDFLEPPSDLGDLSTDSFDQVSSTTLRFGSSGSEVERLQRELRQRGYNPGPIDGEYGRQTQRAVREFQRDNDLLDDGIAGSETLAALELLPDLARNPYVVVVPIQNEGTLRQVRRVIPGATSSDSRRGRFVKAGEFPDRDAAESLSYLLRSQGFDARVAYFR